MSEQNKMMPQLDKLHEIEIEKVFGAMMSIQTLRLQLGTFFGTMNLTTLSIAFSTKKAGFFLFAGLLLFIFASIDRMGLSALFAFYHRSIQLKEQFAPNDEDSFLYIMLLGRWEKQLREIGKISDRIQRWRALDTLGLKNPSPFGFWLPVLGGVIEIACGILFCLLYNWSLF